MSKIKAIVATVLTISTIGFGFAARAQSPNDSVGIFKNQQQGVIQGNNSKIDLNSVQSCSSRRINTPGNDGCSFDNITGGIITGNGSDLKINNQQIFDIFRQ